LNLLRVLRLSVNQPYADFLTCQKLVNQSDFIRRTLAVFVERNGASQTKTGKAKFTQNFER
jgi:hypothetical protein